ncbi:MAG TPA: PAS domain S-box protein, partial [Nitrococcus sp.]|nr:PAS domain S-box protein [Nitrococcus sp.]
ARGRVIRDASGRPRTLQGICMDVTRRKQHHESRAFLASIVESSDDAIVSKSLDGIIQSWNAAAERLFGYAAEQAVGRHIYLIIPADRIDEENQILARLRRGERIEHFDTVRQRSDGQLIHVSLTISPIRDGAGRILGASKIARDITKRMQIEQALRDSEQHLQALTESLERRVEARTAELQRQAVRLRRFAGELASAEQRERKRLAAILHDGLQQLLVAAKIRLAQASSRIQDSRTRSAIEGATELLGQAVASSRNLTRELRPPVLYEGGLIPALRWLASELPRLHGLDIILDAKDVEPPLSDEAKALLFESVRELLFNVAKHSGAKEATVRVLQEERQLQLSVEDQGRGFDVEAAVHEEDPQQLSAGMGLFSIRERLTALGGSMELESAPDKGACIQLTIPLTPLAKGREAAVQEALGPVVAIGLQAIGVAATDSRARVLVVDDHAIVREGIANVLSSDERLVVVGEAADGMEAIEAVEQHRPNVVLIDVNMPRMNGVEATREIHRRWPEVRVVALSVQDDAATAKTMIRAGAAAFISKSDDAAQMIGAVLAAAASN